MTAHWSQGWFSCPSVTPFFSDELTAIYHADSFAMPVNSGAFDLLLTDPPYGMNFRSNYRIVKHAAIAGDDALPVEFLILCDQMNIRHFRVAAMSENPKCPVLL